MKLKYILLAIAGIALIIVLGKNFGSSYTEIPIEKRPKAERVEEEPVLIRNWHYRSEEDKITSDTVYHAYVEANEKLYFEFPYDGGSVVTLMIREKNNDADIILRVSKGQFIPNITGGSLMVRFGKDKAKKYPTSMSSDYSSDVIFINNEREFVKNLKTHETVIIETEFYQAGLKQIEFNIDGLKWDH